MAKRRRRVSIIATAIALPALVFWLWPQKRSDYYQYLILATQRDIPAERWVPLFAPEPLRDPAWVTELCLEPASPVRVDSDSFALVQPSGERFVPVARALRATSRATDSMRIGGKSGGPGEAQESALCLMLEPPPDRHPPYRGVAIWSPKAFRLASVAWSSWDK